MQQDSSWNGKKEEATGWIQKLPPPAVLTARNRQQSKGVNTHRLCWGGDLNAAFTNVTRWQGVADQQASATGESVTNGLRFHFLDLHSAMWWPGLINEYRRQGAATAKTLQMLTHVSPASEDLMMPVFNDPAGSDDDTGSKEQVYEAK